MTELKKIREAVYEIEKSGEMRVPVRFYALESMLSKIQSDRTLRQAQNVAQLPGILEASFVMPDGHEGYGFPIGGVAAFDPDAGGVISPGGVGYDINCGVRLLRTNLRVEDVKPRMRELVHALFQEIPSGVGAKGKLRLQQNELERMTIEGAQWAVDKGFGVAGDVDHCEENGRLAGADFNKVSDAAKKRGAPQSGTLGSGNHFLEIQRVDKIYDPAVAKAFGVNEVGQVTVMVHCGSRGYGHQVCDDYLRTMLRASEKYGIKLPDRELCAAPLDSQEAKDYLAAMSSAVNYAFANRQVITHWTRDVFGQVFKKDWTELGLELVYDVCHNIAKFEEHEVGGKRKRVCVHRKGATRAFWAGRPEIPAAYRNIGQPVIIPGSMETASFLLCGIPTASETFGSSCHGSGRTMSRHEAIRTYGSVNIQKRMAEVEGIVVEAAEPQVLAEEAGGAYKNVDDVVSAVAKAGISKLVARMVPLGVIKG